MQAQRIIVELLNISVGKRITSKTKDQVDRKFRRRLTSSLVRIISAHVIQKIDMYLCKIEHGKGPPRVYAIKRDEAGNRKTLRAIVTIVVHARRFPRAILRAPRKSKIDFQNESDERSGKTCPSILRTVFAQGRRKSFHIYCISLELFDKAIF